MNTDIFPINGTDYVEFYVGNAKQAAHFYKTAFGFQSLAYAGLSTGLTDRESYVVGQGKIKFVFTSPLRKGNSIGMQVEKHGDGVKAIALWVENVNHAYHQCIERGAESYYEPVTKRDDYGSVTMAGFKIYGDTVHLLIERNNYDGPFLPGFITWDSSFNPPTIGLKYIDHMVGNVGWNEMNKWVKFYGDVMGFQQIISFDDKDISTEYTALMSKVMSNDNGRIKFPINEPAEGKKRSQIEEYLDFNDGPGVQHIAMATDDILYTVSELKAQGVEFLTVPESYYDHLFERVGTIDEALQPLRDLNILVDRDEEGYLLQIFTKPVGSRPTLFYEIIQRKGAKSFGKGNFKALFEAIEREQASRGTL